MKTIMLDVKPFQETLHSDMCGPASLKIVLDHYGLLKQENELADLTGVVKGIGVDDSGIERAARSYGLRRFRSLRWSLLGRYGAR